MNVSSNGGAVYNCCSYGALHQIGAEGTYSRMAVIERGGNSTLTNCYYLNGINADTTMTPETGVTKFYKTSDNETVTTTAKVVKSLNDYIESNPSGVSTVGWCKWIETTDHLPVLDFDTEWNGTKWKHWNGTEWIIED